MAKKKSKKKKNRESSFTGEYHNLITIFIGIFLLYSLNSESMGMLGDLMQSVFKGLFGKISILIPFMFMGVGILGFFEKNEYVYRIKSSKLYYVGIVFLFIFYGLLNASELPIDSPTNSYVVKEVTSAAVDGEGCGLVATTLTFYVTKVLGVTGAWLVSVFALLITVMFTFNISLRDVIYTIKSKTSNSSNEKMTLKEKALSVKNAMVNMVTEEVDDKTIVEKNSGLLNKFKKDKEVNVANTDEDVNDKTIKIVGFNKADDDYLEILEGTQSMPELEVLKELQKAQTPEKREVKPKVDNNLEKT
ncbi:MAG: DNA translocase FtsK 4TM domain-containing protein, partial [Paraclostridium sp.]